jgi:hypothetical protein
MKLSNEANAKANQDIEKPPAWNNDDRPPDGGITAWPVVLGAWCILFCSFGWICSIPLALIYSMSNDTGIGTFQSYYETTLLPEYSPSTISWIPSLQVFFMFGMVCRNPNHYVSTLT